MWTLIPFTIVLFLGPSLVNAQAIILFPENNPVVNIIDTIDVQYESDWSAANLTIFCLDPQPNFPNNYAFYGDANNPIPGTGTQQVANIQGDMGITQWPVLCHMLLADTGSNSTVNGGGFVMSSTSGVLPSTYQLPTTSTTSSTPTPSSSTSAGATSAFTATVTVQPTNSLLPKISPTPAAGHSTGAKAGIEIACAIGGLASLGAAYLLISRHRRRRATQKQEIPEKDRISSHKGYAQGNFTQEFGSDEAIGPGSQGRPERKTQAYERYELGG